MASAVERVPAAGSSAAASARRTQRPTLIPSAFAAAFTTLRVAGSTPRIIHRSSANDTLSNFAESFYYDIIVY
jgi:hypothetical protein